MLDRDDSLGVLDATMGVMDTHIWDRLSKLWRWSRFAEDALATAQAHLFSDVCAKLTSNFVTVRLGRIYTLVAKFVNSSTNRTPVVFVHGFAGGVGLWAANIDTAATNRVAYAFDLLGFGRSSRPVFKKDCTMIELQYIQSFEDWRKEMCIEQMIIIAHSFGAYLASSYALEHPQRVRHLVLVDPWGFPEKPLEYPQSSNPTWIKAVSRAFSLFNPLSPMRLAGPYGSSLIKKMRPDLSARYSCVNPDAIYEYIYQCNAQKPTGEVAFSDISFSFGWAKRPMLDRIVDLSVEVPITFVYGSKSWINSATGVAVQEERPESYVDVQVINGAGHHVYTDQKDAFNGVIQEVLKKVDANEDLRVDKNIPIGNAPSATATL